MHNFTGRIESTLGLPVLHFQKIFEHFTQHFRVNSYFALQRLIFGHGEIIAIKYIQNTRAGPGVPV